MAGGEHILVSETLLGKKIENASKGSINEEKEKFMAICYILRSDADRYSKLLEDLRSSANRGRDEYPVTLSDAFDLLVRESGEYDTVQSYRRFNGRGGRGGRGRNYMFAQRGGRGSDHEYTSSRVNENSSNEIVPGSDGVTHQGITCFGCQFSGHYRNQCPYTTRTGTVSMHVGILCAQGNDFNIPLNWILLDTCSTCDVTNNPALVNDIRTCKPNDRLTAYTNGGKQVYNLIANLNILPITVHLKKSSMATILSLKTISNIPGARLYLDTAANKDIKLTLEDGRVLIFKQHQNGLYFYDTNVELSKPKPLLQDYSLLQTVTQDYSLLQTVTENKSYFTRQEIKGADTSRKLQEYLYYPGNNTYKKYVTHNLMNNCAITADDVSRAEAIYGSPVPYLQGHMVRRKPQVHDKIEKIPLPPMIAQHHLDVALAMDFFFVNGNIFFHTKSNKIDFLTAQYCISRSLRTIFTALESVINKYRCRSFKITDFHGDSEFDKEKLKDFLEPGILHTYAREEHVGIIERSVRSIKERCRSTVHGMPYKRMTILMVKSLVEGVVGMMNAFPSKQGISDTLSPSTIVEGKSKLDLKRKIITFGTYALIYTTTSNNMKSRAVPGIALRRSNSAGGHYFMSLHSGKRIHGYNWDELPTDDYVIERVEALAMEQGQPLMHDGVPSFEWMPGHEVEDVWNEDQGEFLAIAPEVPPVIEPVENNEPAHIEVGEEQNDFINDDEIEQNDNQNENDDGLIIVPEDNIVSDDETFIESEVDPMDDVGMVASQDNAADEVIVADVDDTPVGNDRPRRANAGQGIERLQMDFKGKGYQTKREFNFITNGIKEVQDASGDDVKSYMKLACDVIFTQMTAKKGFKKHGAKAFAAMIKEFTQLNEGAVPGKPVVIPTDSSSLTATEKRKALRAVNLIKEKWNGDIKGRSCVDGSQQRRYLKQDESMASPTAALESLLVTLLVDAYEDRDVGTYDVPGAYLQASLAPKDNGERVLMKLVGEFVDIMCKVNPEHEKNVVYENGQKVLYMEILQAIYGCIESALRWYELYSETLKKEGFVINPYDRCVANKEINGKQCTIVWYVDDNKVSHVDPQVVTDVIDLMKSHFGELTVTRGKKHRFLGMNIEINKDRNIEIEMKDQLLEAVHMFEQADGNKVDEVVNTPARPRLRDINLECTQLCSEKQEVFHSIVSKLLWTIKRARPDLETAIGFLCTRVSKSDEDDWLKLRRAIAYIKCTIDDVRVIGASSLIDIFTWIDAAYAVNPDMKSQTGGAISLGVGVLHAKSSKQKLNVKSSTEAELVGNSEYLPYNLWLLNFMSMQGYTIKNNVLYQDNQSTILMLKNGRNSCTGNSRHIHIRYFFVKDRVDKKEVKIEYCPSLDMLADFFTKPLQGKLFLKFKEVLMGHKPITSLK